MNFRRLGVQHPLVVTDQGCYTVGSVVGHAVVRRPTEPLHCYSDGLRVAVSCSPYSPGTQLESLFLSRAQTGILRHIFLHVHR